MSTRLQEVTVRAVKVLHEVENKAIEAGKNAISAAGAFQEDSENSNGLNEAINGLRKEIAAFPEWSHAWERRLSVISVLADSAGRTAEGDSNRALLVARELAAEQEWQAAAEQAEQAQRLCALMSAAYEAAAAAAAAAELCRAAEKARATAIALTW